MLLRFSETGFGEKGWDAAVLEEQHRDHVAGGDHFLTRLAESITRPPEGRTPRACPTSAPPGA